MIDVEKIIQDNNLTKYVQNRLYQIEEFQNLFSRSSKTSFENPNKLFLLLTYKTSMDDFL